MSVISAFFGSVATWFGFVGSCIASPSGPCLPFAVFVAVGAVASAALVFVWLAYRFIRARPAVGDAHAAGAEPRPEPSHARIGATPVTA
jgi:hypothetical protein